MSGERPARAGLLAVVLGTLAAAGAYAAAFAGGSVAGWGAWLMVLGIALSVVGLMVMGAARPGQSLGLLGWAFGFTFLVLVICFGVALALPAAEVPGMTLHGGLPGRAALVLYGVGLLPSVVLPLVYALTFREGALDAESIARIRAAGNPAAE